jgi:phosphate starvation-inducible membrane PsiE
MQEGRASEPAAEVAGDFESRLRRFTNHAGNLLVESFHLLGLFAIGASTVWASVATFLGMVVKGNASIDDLLLLFIYLEIGAMVGIYFKTNRMPVRFLIYVGITAVTRHVVVATTHKAPEMEILLTAAAILVLALAVVALRFGSYYLPSASSGKPYFHSDIGGKT